MKLASISRKILIVVYGMVVGSCLLALSACASTPLAEPGPVAAQPLGLMGQEDFSTQLAGPQVLRPSDQIRVSVFREPDLSLEAVPVSADGMISLPLIGAIQVAGMTPVQVEDRIEELLGARYLRNPEVAVNVLEYASHQVTVEGAVETPGVYDFRPGTRLSGAIAMAEGATRSARTSEVAVFRQVPGGMQVAKFDYRAVSQGMMIDPVLEPGDRVIVGTDNLSVFWQDLLKALPAFALFTNINF